MPLELQSDIRYLKGVGESRAQLYHKLGVDTVEDLLYHIPRRYVDLTHPTPLAEAIPGQKCAVRALLAAKGREQRIRRGLSVFRLTAVDGPVTLHITFFNAKYTVDSLREGEEYLFYGTLAGGFYTRQMDSPQVFRPEEAGKEDELAAYLQKNPAAQVTLTGYADVQTGNHRLNKTLSARRAQAVADALTAKGIADRITADSQGDTVQPFATPEENRVTICITADAPGM
mgnify:CR=1 FL=1